MMVNNNGLASKLLLARFKRQITNPKLGNSPAHVLWCHKYDTSKACMCTLAALQPPFCLTGFPQASCTHNAMHSRHPSTGKIIYFCCPFYCVSHLYHAYNLNCFFHPSFLSTFLPSSYPFLCSLILYYILHSYLFQFFMKLFNYKYQTNIVFAIGHSKIHLAMVDNITAIYTM